MTIRGQLVLESGQIFIARSYLSASGAPAVTLTRGELQTFVQGGESVLADARSRLDVTGGVLVGAVARDSGAAIHCAGTLGTDYAMLGCLLPAGRA